MDNITSEINDIFEELLAYNEAELTKEFRLIEEEALLNTEIKN